MRTNDRIRLTRRIVWTVLGISSILASVMIAGILWATLGYGQTPMVRPFSGLHSVATCSATTATNIFNLNTNRRLATATNESLTSVRIGINSALSSTNGQRVNRGETVTIRGSDYLGSVWCISEGPGATLASVGVIEVGR